MYGALQTGEAAQQNRDGVMAALVGSRICHDLISPIGAIANGVELMGLAPGGGSAGGAELALISQSVDSANARIRFFRLAFGAAGDGSAVARPEVLSIIEALNGASRLKIDWQTGPDLLRGLVKLGFLAILAAESGLPYGGEVTVTTPAPGRMSLVARASRTRFDAALWSRLTDRRFGADPEGLRPAEVQFALFPDEVRRQGRQPRLDLTETGFVLEF
jgi:histidine phosphotransferase ChpT